MAAGDGTGRLFVAEQGGRIRVVRGGRLDPTPFLDISARVRREAFEQGLLGLAFPPDFARSGWVYVDYTRGPDGAVTVSRFRLASPDAADPASEEVLLQVRQPYANHNGGQLAFGPRDGYLYVAVGDGAADGDPAHRAQDPGLLAGKLLRLEVGADRALAAPDNPFVGRAGWAPEVWALGLRNPWRFAFDRVTGDLYVADVGENELEEVDWRPGGDGGGANFGWPILEGTRCLDLSGSCDPSGFAAPVAEYGHDRGCAVVGGLVYRGAALPELAGAYVYGDFCSGRVWGLRRAGDAWSSAELAASGLALAAFGEDEAGELYAADAVAGVLYRLTGRCQASAPLARRATAAHRLYLPAVGRGGAACAGRAA
jgi:glucose/arabinose dehydrogenase